MRSAIYPGLFVLLVGCGFESQVEGVWSPVPGSLEPSELVARGVPKPSARQLAHGKFLAEDGVVYLGVEHEQSALARYVIERVDGDCAMVHFEANDPAGKVDRSETIEACLDDDVLTLRHSAGHEPLSVTFRRQ